MSRPSRWLLLLAPILSPEALRADETKPLKAWVNDLAPITEKDWTPARAAHLLERRPASPTAAPTSSATRPS